MKKILSLVLAFLLLAPLTAVHADFSDVPANHRFSADIEYVQDIGLTKQNLFKPDGGISRGEFASWILKQAGFTNTSYKPKTEWKFLDVMLTNNSYAPYIYRLYDLGIVQKEKNRPHLFYPKKAINKIDALKWIFALEGIRVPLEFDRANFKVPDVHAESVNAPIVAKAISLDIFENNKKVSLFNKLTRGEAAHILKRTKDSRNEVTVTVVPSFDSNLSQNPKFETLNGVWSQVFDKYLRKDTLKQDELIYGSIEGIIKEIGDKHTDFERPGDNAVLDSLSNQVEGIGAVIQLKDEDVVIVSPIVNSPAERAGLLPGDIITSIDGTKVKNMKLNEVVRRIKGKRGTTVTLIIKRDSKELTIPIVRDIVQIVSVSSKRTNDNYLVVALNNFGESTVSEFQKVVDEAEVNPPAGIVIDLRNNPGGFLTTAVRIAGYFINAGEKVAVIRYTGRTEDQVSSGEAQLAKFKKIAVIVNQGSASASEILAGALQDFGIAKIVGEKSFGKGTVQEISEFADGSTLKLTVAEWLTPKGRSIEGNGIVPDYGIALTEQDRKAQRDPQMDRALEELRKM